MAFIRKRGGSYYLVHNIRKDGQVRQVHLACLGRRPRISDEVIRAVESRHPFVEVDWQGLKQKASQQLVRPSEMGPDYLRSLATSAQNLNLDVAALHFPSLEMTYGRDLVEHFLTALKLLRTTVDVKLRSRKFPAFEARSGRGRR